jgi:PAS domain S-box-containing protein
VTQLFGYFPEELVGESIECLVPPEVRPRHGDHVDGFFASPHARQMGEGLDLAGQHRDGKTFAIDVSLTPVQLRGKSYVAAFVRDARERRRNLDRLRALNDITQRLLSGDSIDSVLPIVAERARRLAGARASWVVMPLGGDQLVIAAADGPDTAQLVGTVLSDESSRSAIVMRSGQVDYIDDFQSADNVPSAVRELGIGPGIYVPMIADERRLGTLVIARETGAPKFEALETALAQVFASSTAVAIELGQARSELGRLALVEEDERIARDLHDTVIQQLFAIGMSLQATRNATTGKLAERIDTVVSDLDNVIKEVRNTIFRIPGRATEVRGLRDEMMRVASKYSHELGFTPRVGFHGAAKVAISDVVSDQLLKVLGEALSNVARHATASSAEVVAMIDPTTIRLTVSDDGVGIPSGPKAGQGLRNMSERAANLGGEFSVTPREPHGTLLEWSVPL